MRQWKTTFHARLFGRTHTKTSQRAAAYSNGDHRDRFKKAAGIEGSIANEYFRSWSGITLQWKSLKRRPILDDWQTYKSRSALRDDSRSNCGATHPVNAMLDYAYAVLMAQTQVRLIAEGYDPTIGVLHDRESDRGTYPAFALDHMEPMRPVVDRAVLHLIDTVTFAGADFSIQPDGVCRLNPELARRVAQSALTLVGPGWSQL